MHQSTGQPHNKPVRSMPGRTASDHVISQLSHTGSRIKKHNHLKSQLACRYENDFHGNSCNRTQDTFHNKRYKDSHLHPEFGLSSFQRAAIVQMVRLFGGQSLYVDAEEYDPVAPPCSAKEGDTLGFQCQTIVPNLKIQL